MFDVENGIALQAVQGNRASFRGEEEIYGFTRVAAQTWGIVSSCDVDGSSKLLSLQ